MATQEERNKLLNEVKDRLGNLPDLDQDALARKDLGAYSFTDASKTIALMLNWFKQLRNRDIDELGAYQLRQLLEAATATTQLCQRILAFNPKDEDNPNAQHEAIIEQAQNLYDDVFDKVYPVLSYTATQETNSDKQLTEAMNLLESVEKLAVTTKTNLLKYEEEAKSALAAVQKQAAEAGVSQNAAYFQQEAERQKGLARNWLWCLIGLSLLAFTIAVLGVVVAFCYTPSSAGEAIQYISAKIILLSVVMTMVVVAAKNYGAHRHNQTLNVHRTNALSTFRTFVEGTNDESVRNAILLQACACVFAPRSTGFESGEKDQQQLISPVLELVGKTIPPAKDGV